MMTVTTRHFLLCFIFGVIDCHWNIPTIIILPKWRYTRNELNGYVDMWFGSHACFFVGPYESHAWLFVNSFNFVGFNDFSIMQLLNLFASTFFHPFSFVNANIFLWEYIRKGIFYGRVWKKGKNSLNVSNYIQNYSIDRILHAIWFIKILTH